MTRNFRLGAAGVTAAFALTFSVAAGAGAAQDNDQAKSRRRQETSNPAPARTSGQERQRAVPRESPPPREGTRTRETAPPPRAEAPPSRRESEPRAVAREAPARVETSSDDQSRREQAVQRGGSRPREGRVVQGRSVPREIGPRPRQTIIYYPRRDYPWGYGGFGLGYFYYDPYAWGPYYYPGSYYGYPAYGGYSGYPAYGGYYGYGRGYYGYGAIRLKVKPREAEVFVDGYYVGRVDNFDGVFQRLELEAGPHRIEIRPAGRQPVAFDVRIIPGETISYTADLRKLP